MLRNVLLAIGACLLAWLAVDLVFTSETEQVEAEIERLKRRAVDGGDDAVDDILAAFAADYRGGGPFSRDAIERRLRSTVGAGRVTEIRLGGYEAIWADGVVKVPILRVTASIGGDERTVILTLTWTKEDDDVWRIAEITRLQWG